jgi:predicted ATPase
LSLSNSVRVRYHAGVISRLRISNFKSLYELDIEFGQLTVIVGPNGCGKSSVLQAIAALRDLVLHDDMPRRFPAASLARGATQDAVANHIQFELEFAKNARFSGQLFVHDQPPQRNTLKDESILDSQPRLAWGPSSPLLAWAQHVELYQFDKAIMQAPAYAHTPFPVLGPRGEDLPAILDTLQGEQREQFVAIEHALCGFIPGLERIRLRRTFVPTGRDSQGRPLEGVGHMILFDFEHAKAIPADQASEGTVLLLGLLTVIGSQPGPPTTIMLDDLDRGLHPKAQAQLIGYLRELLAQRPDLQIIATTHSPYLVEHLQYSEVLAMTLSRDDGRSRVAPLAKHPEAERWCDEMSAGEFWSSVGEDWVADAR